MAYIKPMLDIFGVSMYFTAEARLKEFHAFYAQLYNLEKLNLQVPVVDLLYLVQRGFLSPQSASYFLAGRASKTQVEKLSLFSRSCEILREKGFNDFQILKSWQKTSVAVPESTFLYPLEELVSDVDFSDETSEYFDSQKEIKCLVLDR